LAQSIAQRVVSRASRNALRALFGTNPTLAANTSLNINYFSDDPSDLL
jgi:hypothetical protein